MTKLPILLCAAAIPAVLLFACATDNGDAIHGPQFGPTPGRADGAVDGSAPGEEGGPLRPGEGGADADAAQPMCTDGTVAVLAGGDTSLSGAVQSKGGAWSGGPIAAGVALSAPSLVAFGSGFAGLTRGAADAVQSVAYTTSWSGAATLGGLLTKGTPALTVVGAKAHAVLFASGSGAEANKFVRIENAGTSWTPTAEAVTSGGNPSFGQSAGTVAAAGAELVFAQDGGDNEGLYVQKWNGAWSDGVAITGAGTLTSVPPALVAVDGKFDLALLYADNTAANRIGYATRDATTKTWSTAAVTQNAALTREQMSVARIAPFTILVTFRGNNQRPYYMTGTLGVSAISWSAPAAMLADMTTVDAAPAVTKGVCGDDAIAVFASGGQVKATRYRGTAWTAPETVAGATGSRVSVATR